MPRKTMKILILEWVFGAGMFLFFGIWKVKLETAMIRVENIIVHGRAKLFKMAYDIFVEQKAGLILLCWNRLFQFQVSWSWITWIGSYLLWKRIWDLVPGRERAVYRRNCWKVIHKPVHGQHASRKYHHEVWEIKYCWTYLRPQKSRTSLKGFNCEKFCPDLTADSCTRQIIQNPTNIS